MSVQVKRLCVLLMAALFTSSCMYLPALRDDFTVMRDDVFTRTIKGIRGGKGNELVIDLNRGWIIGSSHFSGMTARQLESYFREAGGVCHKDNLDSAVLLCKINRAWKYKNIGAYSDPASWCVPSMALTYKFHIVGHPGSHSTWYELEFFAVNSGVCPVRGK